MQSIYHSEAAGRAQPVLLSWLRGLGQDVRPFAGERIKAGDTFIVTEGEKLPAPRSTLVLSDDGDRRLVRAGDAAPARLAYGAQDLVFGHAFAAALLRGTAPTAADPTTLALFALAERIAASDITVLVNGPTGTGKEVLARHIHTSSPRKDGPFVAVNCAALPETMLEALLFGHTKGAFTGAAGATEGFFRAANGGTLLLDEIAEMPIGLQAKLLRVLQEKEVVPLGATTPEAIDVRVIACANRDLPAEVEAGRFRADLYYRLSVFPLSTSPLRDRRQDIAALAATMILRHAGNRASIPWPSQDALDALQGHDWPGNVRELENVIQRALLLSSGDRIEAAHIVFDASSRPLVVAALAPDPTLGNIVRLHEVQAIRDALAACGGNRIETARRLGVSERTLRYRLARIREAGGDIAPEPERLGMSITSVGAADRVMAIRAQILERNDALQRAAKMGQGAETPQAGGAGGSFGATMEAALKQVNQSQSAAAKASEAYERGETVDVAQVMLARQQASIAFEATLQARNKLLSAYKDIMSMPV